jgi:phage repressor protein C with HTH and peptisase S24 domain
MSKQNLRQVDILEKTKTLSQNMGPKISKADLSQYVNDKVEPRQDKLYILAQALNVSEAWLMGFDVPLVKQDTQNKNFQNINTIYEQLESDRKSNVYKFAIDQLNKQNGISEVPKKYIVKNRCTAAGAPIDGDYEDAQQEIVVRNEVPRGADEVVTIAGDSMQPLLMRGSQAFVHYQPVPDYDGQIVIVSIKDIGVTCKKIYREDGKIRLKSINEKYSDMIYPAQDVRVIGKVITQKK